MTRTFSTGSRSWLRPTRVCFRGTVVATRLPYPISRFFRNMLVNQIGTVSARGGRSTLLVIAALAPLFAHDMWIEPTTFAPEPGQIVGVRLRVGQDLLGDPLPRNPTLIKQFVVEDADGRRPVLGRDGADPAGFLRVAMTGLLVIGYRSNASAIELAAEKFNQYLKDEGLDAAAALRARRNETGAG